MSKVLISVSKAPSSLDTCKKVLQNMFNVIPMTKPKYVSVTVNKSFDEVRTILANNNWRRLKKGATPVSGVFRNPSENYGISLNVTPASGKDSSKWTTVTASPLKSN